MSAIIIHASALTLIFLRCGLVRCVEKGLLDRLLKGRKGVGEKNVHPKLNQLRGSGLISPKKPCLLVCAEDSLKSVESLPAVESETSGL